MHSHQLNPIAENTYSNIYQEDRTDRGDFRGTEVYDVNHAKLGIISEVYCSNDTLMAKFVEIIPYEDPSDRNICFPFERLQWSGYGPVFLDVSKETLLRHIEYDFDYVFEQEGDQLMPYHEALDLWLGGSYAYDQELLRPICA